MWRRLASQTGKYERRWKVGPTRLALKIERISDILPLHEVPSRTTSAERAGRERCEPIWAIKRRNAAAFTIAILLRQTWGTGVGNFPGLTLFTVFLAAMGNSGTLDGSRDSPASIHGKSLAAMTTFVLRFHVYALGPGVGCGLRTGDKYYVMFFLALSHPKALKDASVDYG